MSADQPRGPDLANAAARMGIALGPAIVGSALFAVLDLGFSPWVFLLWFGGLLYGPIWAWGAWHAKANRSTVRITGDELAGRTRWPLRRWRSVRLDRLARVRYYRLHTGTTGTHYLSVRDQGGGRVMAELASPPTWDKDPDDALRRAVGASPAVRVGSVTRRRLAGGEPWWAFWIFSLGMLVFFFGSFLAAIGIAVGLGALGF